MLAVPSWRTVSSYQGGLQPVAAIYQWCWQLPNLPTRLDVQERRATLACLATTLAIGAVAVAARLLTRPTLRKSRLTCRAVVTDLHRFAVKGLERDTMEACTLKVGDCFPADRMWALMRTDKLSEFDAKAPQWLDKMKFHAACSAGPALARLQTEYDDPSTRLTVRSKQSGALLLQAVLDDCQERQMAEQFFEAHLCGCSESDSNEIGVRGGGVRIVRAVDGNTHQFGNTTSGVKANGDVRTIHLVNRETVESLSHAAGVFVDPLRFRANILFDKLPPWEEFQWVGLRIAIGTAVELQVVKRTVRCAGTCADPTTAENNLDVPELLRKHFPEHGPYLGIYAQVLKAGTIRCGDELRVCS